MTKPSQHGHARRERTRANASLNLALDGLVESQRLARIGDLAAAERATRLAERHAKLAERLIDLKAAFRRIAEARRIAEQTFEEHCAAREAALKARERKIFLAELAQQQPAPHTPPLDPEAGRLRERLSRLRSEAD